jgi:S1-C subfamily serine protease
MIQLKDISASLAALIAGAAPSLVSINSRRSRSSGFVWRPGLIVTADEALAEEGAVTVTLPGGESIEAHIAGRDAGTDIALLKAAPADLPPLALTTEIPAVGALALAAGARDGTPTAALGAVSLAAGPWYSLRGSAIDARLELAVRLPRSAEGGVALNAEGQAFGMAVSGPRRRTLVIPSATIARIAARLERDGRVPRGYLGLGLQPVAVEGGLGSGAIIMGLDANGPGAQAGLHQGDVILTWNGEPVRYPHRLQHALGPESVGQAVTLGYRRGGERRDVSVTIGERPPA